MALSHTPSCRRRQSTSRSNRSFASHAAPQNAAPQVRSTIILTTRPVEERQDVRYSSQMEVHLSELTPTNDSLAALTAGRVDNMSRHGMCVTTSRPLTMCSCVRCEISLPNSPVQLPTLMQVRWVKEIADSAYQCGLSYLL